MKLPCAFREHSVVIPANHRLGPAPWLAIVACLGVALGAQQQPRFEEQVEVTRVVIDTRVVNGQSQPVLGLDVDDFEVTIGGRDVRVESAVWVGEEGRVEEDERPADTTRVEREGPGRLIVFLFQKSMEALRITGLMRLLLDLRDYVDTFTPRDRIAVLSFDTQLLFWLDFTNDIEAVRDVLKRGILFTRPGPTQAARGLSLMDRLEPLTARRTYSIERALRLLGEALEPLPGAKTLVLVGHGFGTLSRFGVTMEREYDHASSALQRARVTVVSLDVTQLADEHSLEAGLRIVADETGGFYEPTQLFTGRPLTRLTGALAGHYVLIVHKPDLSKGEHPIRVKLTRRQGTVLARRTFIE